MLVPQFIFLNLKKREFFRSVSCDPAEGFRPLSTYALASGGVDFVRLETDCQDLKNEGWREVPSTQFIEVKLYYMKESGKYYSEGILRVSRAKAQMDPTKNWMETCDMILQLQKSGPLPGLYAGSEFDIFVTGDEHPGGYPQLFKKSNHNAH